MVLFTWGALKIGSIGMVRNGYWCTLKVAFENLLWFLKLLDRKLDEKKWRSKIFGDFV